MISAILAEDLALRRKRDRERLFPTTRREIKEILTDVGVRDIARGVGVNPSQISRIFNGEISPRLSMLEEIAQYLTKAKGRTITAHDVIDLIHTQPWKQPLNIADAYRQ